MARRTLACGLAVAVCAFTALASEGQRSTRAEFEELLHSLARAWSQQNSQAALDYFTEDAVYMQPPDQQLYRGLDELKVLFDGLRPGTLMQFHHLAFSADSQLGFAEFTFGRTGASEAVHGVVVVGLSGGRIASWREYFESGPASFADFVATDGKTWKWTAESLQ